MGTASDVPEVALETQSRYKRELGMWSVVLLAIGAILGPAVGFTPISVLALGGPAGILSWVIAFVLILALGMTYVELGTMWPRAGGVAYYPARSSGPIVGVMNAWGSFIGYAVSVPSIVVAFVQYLSYWFPSLYKNGGLSTAGIIWAIILVVVTFGVNTLRIRHIGRINNILTIASIVGLLIMFIALFGHYHAANFTQYHGFMPLGSGGLFLAIAATIYAYGGFRQPIDYAEEVKDPGRTIPKAIFITLVVTMVIYSLESWSFVGAINWRGMGLPVGDWAKLGTLSYPLVTVAHGALIPTIGLVALLTALMSSFRDGYIYFGGASRVGHTLSRYDGYLPKLFSSMTNNGIPLPSVILVVVVSIIYIVLLPSFSSLFPLVGSALVLSYAPGPLSLAIFRARHPNEPRPYVLPLYKFIAPFAFIVSTLMIYWSGWNAVHILVPSVFVGLLLLFFYARRRRITAEDVRLGIWFPIFQILIVVVSYFGSTTFGGRNVIPAPWDSILIGALALLFYFVGYAAGVRYQGHAVFDAES